MAMGMLPYVFEGLIEYLMFVIFINDRNVVNCNFNCCSIGLNLERISISIENNQALDHLWVHCFYLIDIFECQNMQISSIHRILHQHINWSETLFLYWVKDTHVSFNVRLVVAFFHLPANEGIRTTNWCISYLVDLLDAFSDII